MGQILQRCKQLWFVKPVEFFSGCVLNWSLKSVILEIQRNILSWDSMVTAEIVMQGHVSAVPCCATPEHSWVCRGWLCEQHCAGDTAAVSQLCALQSLGCMTQGHMFRLHVSPQGWQSNQASVQIKEKGFPF